MIELLQSKIVWICVFTWFLCQCTKFSIHAMREKHGKAKQFFSSGGMPSSHAAIVAAFASLVYLEQGMSALFLTAGLLATITIYDAIVFRRQLGIQARAINQLAKGKVKLQASLGHEPAEVLAGVIIGIALAVLLY